MRPLLRQAEPPQLTNGFEKWTRNWVVKRKLKPPGDWNGWPRTGMPRKPLNQWLTPVLSGMTGGKCSFCDTMVEPASLHEVEHYLAKTTHPDQAFAWANLYLICHGCNTLKNDTVAPGAMRPDENCHDEVRRYRFEACYRYHQGSGRITTNPMCRREVRIRALATLRLYRLNRRGLCNARIQALADARELTSPSPLRPYLYLLPWTRRA
jgi:uncharacterized protein (TIGR02646 family)